MLGVGGIGSHAFIDMVAIGFQDIRIVDFDHIELSNFNRQILYGEPFIGQPKVKVAAEKARALNSGIKLDTVQTRLTSADDVYEVVKDRDIVVAAVDRPKTEMLHWLNEGCVRAGTALITGGVETQRAFYYTVVPGVSGCAECWRAQTRAENPGSRLIFDEFERQALSGEPFGEDTAAFNGLVILDSAFMVGELVRLSSRVTPPLSIGRVLEASFHDPRLREVESWKANPECPMCQGATPKASIEWTASIDERPF
jgi:molybdopterin/thiamine biosynthesis adenylyltransferase